MIKLSSVKTFLLQRFVLQLNHEKSAIYKICNFFDSGQACFVTTYHLGTQENRSLHIDANLFLS